MVLLGHPLVAANERFGTFPLYYVGGRERRKGRGGKEEEERDVEWRGA